ncbi:MAG TPA: hypothetical protein VIJ11_10910 [Galbitalea sp.]
MPLVGSDGQPLYLQQDLSELTVLKHLDGFASAQISIRAMQPYLYAIFGVNITETLNDKIDL